MLLIFLYLYVAVKSLIGWDAKVNRSRYVPKGRTRIVGLILSPIPFLGGRGETGVLVILYLLLFIAIGAACSVSGQPPVKAKKTRA